MLSRWIFVLQIAFLFTWFSVGVVGGQESHRVKWVSDGDTIVLSDGRSVRYIGVDAPEIDHENQRAEPFGYKAKEMNGDMVLGRVVRLEFDAEKFDRYGRLLAYVYLEDGTFVNGRMVERGFAYYLFKKPNIRLGAELLELQREAMRAERGIWSALADPEGAVYIGNRNSRRFHSETCEFGRKTGLKNRVSLHGKRDAFYEGFAPCRRCLKSGKR